MGYPQYTAWYLWKSKTFHPELFNTEVIINLDRSHIVPAMVSVISDPFGPTRRKYCVNRRRLKALGQREP
jgi:hypothetical protein